MEKKFSIGQSNEIIKDDKIFDLHNSYEFIGIVLKSKERYFQILFEPSPEYGKGKLPVSLHFDAIDYLEFSPNFGTRLIYGLDEIGYKNPDDRDEEWLLSEQQSTHDDHLFFRLDGGDFIRVHCQHADIVEGENLPFID
jgi:hypothetical protein